jgi:hypothetical protein
MTQYAVITENTVVSITDSENGAVDYAIKTNRHAKYIPFATCADIMTDLTLVAGYYIVTDCRIAKLVEKYKVILPGLIYNSVGYEMRTIKEWTIVAFTNELIERFDNSNIIANTLPKGTNIPNDSFMESKYDTIIDPKPITTKHAHVEISTDVSWNNTKTNPIVTNLNVTNPSVTNPIVTNPNVINPSVTNLNVTNPSVTNLNVTNPSVTNLNVTNPSVTNLNVTNPSVTNPIVTNPNVTNLIVPKSTPDEVSADISWNNIKTSLKPTSDEVNADVSWNNIKNNLKPIVTKPMIVEVSSITNLKPMIVEVSSITNLKPIVTKLTTVEVSAKTNLKPLVTKPIAVEVSSKTNLKPSVTKPTQVEASVDNPLPNITNFNSLNDNSLFILSIANTFSRNLQNDALVRYINTLLCSSGMTEFDIIVFTQNDNISSRWIKQYGSAIVYGLPNDDTIYYLSSLIPYSSRTHRSKLIVFDNCMSRSYINNLQFKKITGDLIKNNIGIIVMTDDNQIITHPSILNMVDTVFLHSLTVNWITEVASDFIKRFPVLKTQQYIEKLLCYVSTQKMFLTLQSLSSISILECLICKY